MFLIPSLPHDVSRLGEYADALALAYDLDEFRRFYADYFGRELENEVDTQGGFCEVLFRLVERHQKLGTLCELLVMALCYRASNRDLVKRLQKALAIEKLISLADLLADSQCPPTLGQQVVDAQYDTRRWRKPPWRPWADHETRAAWIEILVVCDKQIAGDDRTPPLIKCLHAIDREWRPSDGSRELQDKIAAICSKYGLPQSDDGSFAETTRTGSDGVPRAILMGDTARSVYIAAKQRPLSAIRCAWRAATSDGQGAYQLAMIAFGLTAFLFHDSLQPQKLEQQYLKDMVSLRQEPLRSDQYPVLDGLLLPSANNLGAAGNDADRALCDADLIGVLDAAYTTFRDAYGKERAYDLQLKPTEQRETEGLGQSWTDTDKSTTLLIPSPLAYTAAQHKPPLAALCQQVGELAGQPGPLGERCGYDPCAKDGIPARLQCLFEAQIKRSQAIAELADIQRKHSDKISSFYFISPEGIERSIPHFTPQRLAAHRIVNGESYVYRALSREGGVFLRRGEGEPQAAGKDKVRGRAGRQCRIGQGSFHRTGTLPYFDLLGSGIQETACYPVDVSATDDDAKRTGEPTIVGVLCADITLPRNLILSRLVQASTIFDLSIVELSRSSNGDVVVQTCHDPSRMGFPCSPAVARLDEEVSERLARSYYRDRLATDRSRDSAVDGGEAFGMGGVTMIDNHHFGIVVASGKPDEGPWEVAIGRVRTAKSRNYLSLTLCALTLLAGLWVLVASFRRKLKRQQALLARGLPYGLLEIEDGKIIGANDRAEEILLTNLPRLGTRASRRLRKQTLSGMLEDRCVLIPASGRLRTDDIRTYESTIRDRTSDGLTSMFYAWVKIRRGWIKITSTVILTPDNKEQVFCALDTNIDEAHRLFLANVHQGGNS